MHQRATYIRTITKCLVSIRTEVELNNSLNLQDINVYAENFFRDFLNLLYGYNLKNANRNEQNMAVIDLFEEDKRFVIQVTSDNTSDKVHKTINGFNESTLHASYHRLIMLIITTKKIFPKAKFAQTGNLLFEKESDIWDLTDILRDINDLQTESLALIHDFLIKEVAFKIPISKSHKVSNQVETIMKLVDFLTQNSDVENTVEQEPDPQGKILRRFADYSAYLMNRWTELAPFYSTALEEAKKVLGIDGVKAKKVQLYLKRESNRYLNEKNGNPQAAIYEMVLFFNNQLSEGNFDFDELGAEFYLIDELINCNVFPNP